MGLVRYLLDSSVLIETIRKQGLQAEKFLKEKYPGQLYISQISVAELFSGKSAQDREIEKFLRFFINGFKVIELDLETSILAGQLRCFYRLAMPDALIAASAINRGLTLITHNRKDFVKVSGLNVKFP